MITEITSREQAVLTYNSLSRFLDDRYDMVVNPSVRLVNNVTWFSGLRALLLDHLEDEELQRLTFKVKSRLQAEANLLHRYAGRWGLICMATGVGKSKTAIDAIKSLVAFKPDAKVLIVVPTTKLRDVTWMDEFKEWGAEEIWNANVTKICYASMHKINGEVYDFIVLDEVHNLTEKSAEFFTFNTVSSCMALTATPPENTLKQLLLSKLKIELVYQITLDDAVELGVVAPYEITVIQTELDAVRRNVEAGRKDKRFFTTEFKNYEYYASIENSEDPNVRMKATKHFYINRMRFIYNLNSKLEAAQWLLQNIIPFNRRTLIFCGSIKHAEKLCLHSYHSKSGTEGYDKFIAMEIDRMSCVEALNEGHNIPEVDIAFIDQLNSNGLDLIQRIGRIIRFRVGHVGRIIILCVKGTVDEKWVRRAVDNLDKTKIRWVEYKDIVSGKEVLTF